MNNEIQLNKKIQEIEELKEIKEKFEFNDVEEHYFYCNDYVKFEKNKSNLHKDIKKQRYKNMFEYNNTYIFLVKDNLWF